MMKQVGSTLKLLAILHWMNKLIWLLYLIGGVLLNSACQLYPEVESRNFQEVRLERDTVFEIEIGQEFSDISLYFQSTNSDQVFICDGSSGSIAVLHAPSGKFRLLGKIELNTPVEGFSVDESLGRFLIVSNNTIHVFKDDLNLEFSQSLDDLYLKGFFTFLNREFVPIIKDNHLFIHFFPDDERTYKSKYFFSKPVEGMIDISSGALSLVENSAYPSNYHLATYGYVFAPDRFFLNDKTHGYTFPQNDSVFLRSVSDGFSESHFFGTKLNIKQDLVPYGSDGIALSADFDYLYSNSSFYAFSRHMPLSGFNKRSLMLPIRNDNEKIRKEIKCFYDRDWKYLGEDTSGVAMGLFLDSKDGMMSMSLTDGKLFISNITIEQVP
jgi:hypothetical protein